MEYSTEMQEAYIKQIDLFNKLMKSIKTNMNDQSVDYLHGKMNWGHIGSMGHVIDLLNQVDMHLARTHFEKNIDDRTFDETAKKFK